MEETEIDIRGILSLLWRQRGLILKTFAIIIGIVAIFIFSLTPLYSSNALVLVDTSRKNLLDTEMQTANAAADNARIDSEVEILKTPSLVMRLVQQQNLVADPEFSIKPSLQSQVMTMLRLGSGNNLPTGEEALQAVLGKVRNAITIQRRGLSNLISIEFESEDRAKAARLANAYSEAYIADQLQSKVDSILKGRDALQARIDQARTALVASERSFDTFIDDNIQQITQETGRTDIGDMRRQIDTLVAAREQTARTADAVQANLENGDWQTLVTSLQSDALTALDQQRQEAAARLAGSDQGSQAAIDLRAELARIEDNMRQTATSEVSNLRTAVNDQQTQETSLRADIRQAVLRSDLPPDVLTRIFELQQSGELARTQYQTLLSRVNDLDAQAALQIADSRIVSQALPSNAPSFPNSRLFFILASLGALGVGIALAFLYENYVGGFTREEQVQSVLKVPLASAIPRERTPATSNVTNDSSLSSLVVTSPLSVFAEAVRRIRASIEQTMRKREDRRSGTVVMVSSTAPGEGKSTLALALARSYSVSGRSTLLIDCDLRKPSIHRQLGLQPNSGLVDYLIKDQPGAELADILQIDQATGVSIIVGARRADVATDQLVTSRSFGHLIEAAKRNFDIVILDTPPIGAVVDGLYIAQFADVVTYVVRWASTSQSEVGKALDALKSAAPHETALITVLNQQERSRAAYRNKYAGYYTEAN